MTSTPVPFEPSYRSLARDLMCVLDFEKRCHSGTVDSLVLTKSVSMTMQMSVSVDSSSVPSTFESQPRASAADCPSGATVENSQQESVFESKPQQSKTWMFNSQLASPFLAAFCTDMAQVGLKRQLALALLAAAIFTFSKRPANVQPPRFALRVCEKCVSRSAGNGYNPKGVLQQTAKMAAEAGWPAPNVEWGKCTGGCDYGPTVRLARRSCRQANEVEGMTEDEVNFKAFLAVQSEMEAERAFGLASRHIAESSADEPQPDIEIPA
eukprot:s821_g6.t1